MREDFSHGDAHLGQRSFPSIRESLAALVGVRPGEKQRTGGSIDRSSVADPLAFLLSRNDARGELTPDDCRDAAARLAGWSSSPFPLHLAGRQDTERADHRAAVTVPMLFLSGTRDEPAGLDLLRPVCVEPGDRATLHIVDTADHGHKVLKKSRTSAEDVFVEMARVVRVWATKLDRVDG